MNKTTGLILILVALFLANWFFFGTESMSEKKVPAEVSKDHFPPVPTIYPMPKKKPRVGRRIASEETPVKTHYVPRPQETFVPDPHVIVDRRHVLAQGMGAIEKKKYDPRLGKLISEDQHFKYYQKSGREEASPVAFNSSRQRFRPISNIVHLKGVTEEIRQNLRSSGHEEYYFDAKLRVLFIKSTPNEVIGLYQDLKNQGLNVQLEVLALPYQGH